MSRPRVVPRSVLIAMLLTICIVPPSLVIWFVLTHEPPAEPKLDVNVSLGVMQYDLKRGEEISSRLMQCVRIENPTNQAYRNVSISLNKQFFSNLPQPIPGKQQIALPLEFFITKNGAIGFQTGSKLVERVTVYAQISTGARAVAERYFDADGKLVAPPD